MADPGKAMTYLDLAADTKALYSGYTAPEEIHERAADLWYRLFSASGLTSLAGELNKAHREREDRWVLGWIVGEDEYYYYVMFDPTQHRVFTEKRHKAVRTAN